MNPQHTSEHNRSIICGRYDEMAWIIYGPITPDGLKEMMEPNETSTYSNNPDMGSQYGVTSLKSALLYKNLVVKKSII